MKFTSPEWQCPRLQQEDEIKMTFGLQFLHLSIDWKNSIETEGNQSKEFLTIDRSSDSILTTVRMPIDFRAWPLASALLGLLFLTGLVMKSWQACILPILFLLAHVVFFRDPARKPAGDGLLSPGDGRVVEVSEVFEGRYLNTDAVKIGIFLSVFDVHVNRAPWAGKVDYIHYVPGKFFNALREASVNHNESNWIGIDAGQSMRILVRQIAGAIARRICCDVKIGQELSRGDKLGIICYGSRVECYFPKTLFRAKVRVGDMVKTGQTVLGERLS